MAKSKPSPKPRMYPRDLSPPEDIGGYVEGWDFNVHRMRHNLAHAVYPVWLGYARHGEGHPGHAMAWMSASRGRVSCYSTKRLALLALREELQISHDKLMGDLEAVIQAEADILDAETDAGYTGLTEAKGG